MHKGRIEAFSDGVIAILITIMVLELKADHIDANFTALKPLMPVFLSYVLSFMYLGIYWSNHHHLFQTVQNVNGKILWANLHLLFWLSMIPFTTWWMGENNLSTATVALYGFVLFAAAMAYYVLVQLLITHHGKKSLLASALGSDFKGKASIIIYAVAIVLAFLNPIYSCALYILVAIIWLVPDRRIEKVLESR